VLPWSICHYWQLKRGNKKSVVLSQFKKYRTKKSSMTAVGYLMNTCGSLFEENNCYTFSNF
jgi:hypothetical protein